MLMFMLLIKTGGHVLDEIIFSFLAQSRYEVTDNSLIGGEITCLFQDEGCTPFIDIWVLCHPFKGLHA